VRVIVLNQRSSLTFLLSAAMLLSSAWASRAHQAPTSGHGHHHARVAASAPEASASEDRGSSRRSSRASAKHISTKRGKRGAVKEREVATSQAPIVHRSHGQQSIASERISQIQQALIRERYLDGEASGVWDSTTNAAMQKYQSDQGWQTRLIARAQKAGPRRRLLQRHQCQDLVVQRSAVRPCHSLG
jgi:hypothetical protein